MAFGSRQLDEHGTPASVAYSVRSTVCAGRMVASKAGTSEVRGSGMELCSLLPQASIESERNLFSGPLDTEWPARSHSHLAIPV